MLLLESGISNYYTTRPRRGRDSRSGYDDRGGDARGGGLRLLTEELPLHVGPELINEVIAGVRADRAGSAHKGVAGVSDAGRIPGVGHECGAEGGGESHPG